MDGCSSLITKYRPLYLELERTPTANLLSQQGICAHRKGGQDHPKKSYSYSRRGTTCKHAPSTQKNPSPPTISLAPSSACLSGVESLETYGGIDTDKKLSRGGLAHESGIAVERGVVFLDVPLAVGLGAILVCLYKVSWLLSLQALSRVALTCRSLGDSSRYSFRKSLEASPTDTPLKSPEAHLSWVNRVRLPRILFGCRSSGNW